MAGGRNLLQRLLPSLGKSHFASRLQSLGWYIIQDGLGQPSASFAEALQYRCDIAVDGYNHDVRRRQTWIDLALRHLGDSAQLLGIQFQASVEECKQRVFSRRGHHALQGRGGVEVVERIYNELQQLRGAEGFHRTFVCLSERDCEDVLQILGKGNRASARLGDPTYEQVHGFKGEWGQSRFGTSSPAHIHSAFEGDTPVHSKDFQPYTSTTFALQQQPRSAFGTSSVGGNGWFQQHWRHTQYTARLRDPWAPQPQAEPLAAGHHWLSGGCMDLQGGQRNTSWQSIHIGSQAKDCQRVHKRASEHGSLKRPALGRSAEWNNAVPADLQLHPMRSHSLGYKFDDPKDSRITLLFDLNGTLTTHTTRRRSAGRNRLRPGVKELLKLKNAFRIGIFTSSTERTVAAVQKMLEEALGTPPDDPLFDPKLILSRSYTEPVPPKLRRQAGLKPWDTVKPLGKWFGQMHRVVLLDDDRFKAVPGEEDNMIVVPSWEDEDPEDALLTHLVDAMSKELTQLPAEADVRNCTKAVGDLLADVATGISPGRDADRSNVKAESCSVIADGSPDTREKRIIEQQGGHLSNEPPLEPSNLQQTANDSNVGPFPDRHSTLEEPVAANSHRRKKRKH